MKNFLEAQHITKRYAHHVALSDVTISVPEGQIFGLLGPNGAGKTTLIRTLNRITVPDEGQIIFNGHPLCAADIHNIGYLPEERGLYRKMKVGEQAIYLAQLKGLPAKEAKARLTEWFERFEIMPWWDKKLEELSKGMQQKVQFIITLLHEPQLLILDETFSGFDPVNAQQLKQEIRRLRDNGHTIILSTHNMESVEQMCDTIALINHSQVVLEGEVDEIRRQHRTGLFQATLHEGDLKSEPGLFDVEPAESRHHELNYLIRNTGNLTNSDLCIRLAQQAQLVSFSEKLPTMNEVFLKVVGENAKWADQQIENQQAK